MSQEEGQQESRFRHLWHVLRVCFAVLAVVFIVSAIQYDDVLIKDGQEFRIVERADNYVLTSDGDGKQIKLKLGEDGKVAGYTYQPGAVSLTKNLRVVPTVIAVVIFGFVPLFQTFRWRILLRVQGIVVSLLLALKLTFAGKLMNFFLVSTTGGDLFKAYWISRDKGKRAQVFVSVFVDRFLGLVFITVLSAVLVLIFWRDPKISNLTKPVGLLVLMLVLLILVLFSSLLRKLIRFDKWVVKLPFASVIQKVDQSLLAFKDYPGAILSAGVCTAILQLFASTSTFFLGMGLGIEASLWYFWLYVPLAFLIGSIPVSMFWGLGLMEGAYVLFFAGSGFATVTQAAMLAMGARLIQLLWSLPGSVAVIHGFPKEKEVEE